MVLNFKHFLEEHNIDIKLFLDNCKPQNQRWFHRSKCYNKLVELSTHRPSDWIYDAFSFQYALQHQVQWGSLARRWEREVARADTVVFGFPISPPIYTRLP